MVSAGTEEAEQGEGHGRGPHGFLGRAESQILSSPPPLRDLGASGPVLADHSEGSPEVRPRNLPDSAGRAAAASPASLPSFFSVNN